MSSLDLLTDTDFQTAPKKAVRWKGRWLIKQTGGYSCVYCGNKFNAIAGEEFLTHCKTWATAEEVNASVKTSSDIWFAYLGPIPVEPQ